MIKNHINDVLAVNSAPVVTNTNNENVTSICDATTIAYDKAMEYLEYGLSVIPIKSKSKAPGIKWEAYQKQLPTAGELHKWFVEDGFNNLAIITGEISGIFVVDCDTSGAFESFRKEYGDSVSAIVKTKNGGHFYFKYDDKCSDFKNRVRALPNIDIRTNGGYVIAPPSIHADGDFSYEWFKDFDKEKLKTLPYEFIVKYENAIKKPTGHADSIDALLEMVRNAIDGSRNDTLNKAAFNIGKNYVSNQITEKDAKEKLLEAAHTCGLETYAAENTIISGLTAGIQNQDETPEIPEKPSHIQLADQVIADHKNICFTDRGWMTYNSGIWSEVKSNKIDGCVMNTIRDNYGDSYKLTKTTMNSVRAMLEATPDIYVESDEFDSNHDKIVFKNGVLDIGSGNFGEHYKELHSTISLNYDYDLEAKAPEWEKFLNSIFGEALDIINFLQEFAGYCLTTDTQHETAVWLYGPPGGGKSTFVEGIKAMLGPKVGTLGLAQLNTQFALATIVGKTALISCEQPSEFIKTTDTLNTIISGEEISVERKYKDAYIYRPSAKILWACNELPRTRSGSNGLFRRVKIVEFPKIPKENLNPKIKREIKNEGAGIMLWALVGLENLRSRGYFSVPKCIEEASEKFKLDNDSVAGFIDERCTKGEGYKIKSSTLYNSFRTWCEENGLNPLNNKRFSSDLKSLGFINKKFSDGNYWLGINCIIPYYNSILYN